MGLEIERKYLLANDDWRSEADAGVLFRQGYLNSEKSVSSVRVRIEGDRANINIKSATVGQVRQEFEYEIPLDDAEALLSGLCIGPLIEKRRFLVKREHLIWEIDEFFGDNQGLVVAEVELESADDCPKLPAWIGKEVTDDARYYNACLVKNPFNSW